MKLLSVVIALILIGSAATAEVNKEGLEKQRQGYVDEIKQADSHMQKLRADMESTQSLIQRLAGAIKAMDEALVEKPMGDIEALNKELVKENKKKK